MPILPRQKVLCRQNRRIFGGRSRSGATGVSRKRLINVTLYYALSDGGVLLVDGDGNLLVIEQGSV